MTTKDRMDLIELIEKRPDNDLVRDMLAFAAAHVLDLEVERHTGVPWAYAAKSGRNSGTAIATVRSRIAFASSVQSASSIAPRVAGSP